MNKEQILKTLENFYEAYPIVHKKKPYGYSVNGNWCAGVSSISDFAPKDYLKFWSAKLVSEYLQPRLEEIKGMTQQEFEKLLETAKNQHAKKSTDALEIGTRVHDWVENYIKGNVLPVPKDILNPITEFLKFEKRHEIEWILSEKLVASLKHNVAGRLDSLVVIDGKLSLGDFKTSGQIDENYYLQTAGYQMCLEEMGIDGIEQRVIIRLPKKIDDGFEAVLVDTDYEKDKDAFLHRRYSFQWQNYVNTNFKEDAWFGRKKYKKLKIKKI